MGRLRGDENGSGCVCVAEANIVAVRWIIRWRRVIGLLLVAVRGGRVEFRARLCWPLARSCMCWSDWMLFLQKGDPRRMYSSRRGLHRGESEILLSLIPSMFDGSEVSAVVWMNRGLVLLIIETMRSKLV